MMYIFLNFYCDFYS